ncbi:MAG: fluoride efflux transporter FluC, partial [Pseudonocardiaceae bacterium]
RRQRYTQIVDDAHVAILTSVPQYGAASVRCSAVDSDKEMQAPEQHRKLGAHPAAVLGSISAGGVLGALARYGLEGAFPQRPGEWPWATWSVNVSGCLLIGVLMVLISEVWTGQQLLRPFLGVGMLGGFTTFSTASVEVQQLIEVGAAGTGLAYLMGTVAAALVAVIAGSALTRWVLGMAQRPVGPEGTVR